MSCAVYAVYIGIRYTCKNVGKIMALELNQTCYKNAGVCQTLHKITQPKLDSGLYLQKNILFRPSSFSFIQQRSLKQNKKKTETTKNGFAVFNQRCSTSDDSYAHQQSCKTHYCRTRQTNLPPSSRFPLFS